MKILLLCCALIFSSFSMESVSAQTQKENTRHTRKYIYRYSFENASNEDLIQQVQNKLGGLLHVTEVKYEFKSESQKGQFIITVVENDRTSESEELFSPKMIKTTIIENGLQPIEFFVTEEIIK